MPISNYPISKISLKISGTWSQYLQGFIVSSIQTSVDNFFNNFYGILLLEPFLFTPSFQFPFLQCTILLVLQTSSYSRHNNTMSTISVYFGGFLGGRGCLGLTDMVSLFFKIYSWQGCMITAHNTAQIMTNASCLRFKNIQTTKKQTCV